MNMLNMGVARRVLTDGHSTRSCSLLLQSANLTWSLYGLSTASAATAFHSYSEPHLSTDNELVRDVLLALLASLAKLERQKISERTKAGLERARASGKRLGRVPFSTRDREELRMVLDAGKTWHAASLATGIPYSTVKKHARTLGYSPPMRHRASVG
jgi:Resolvase, N terminal domain